jgi:hypothetical protein
MSQSPAERKRAQRQRAVDAVESGEKLDDVSTMGLIDRLSALIAGQHERLGDVLLELGRRGGVALRRR